mgnify:CR=1 FL=1
MHMRIHKTRQHDFPTQVPLLRTGQRQLRIKTIRHSDCKEVGHDHFDQFVSDFLLKLGEENLVSITPINVANATSGLGQPPAANIIVGTVVTSSNSMIRD